LADFPKLTLRPHGRPFDLLVSNAAQAWAEFAGRDGVLAEYASPELDKLPDFAQVLPNVYTMSLDPTVVLPRAAGIAAGAPRTT
jgi:iron(III) transport system substrate-binding protein